MPFHACLSEILTARSEPRCNLLTIAVWFAFWLITPGDSRSRKQSAPGRENHGALYYNGRLLDRYVTGCGRIRDVGLRGQHAALVSGSPGDQVNLP